MGADPFDHTYTYTQTGNLTTMPGVGAIGYTGRFRATSAGSHTFGYDTAGNLTTRTIAGQPAQTLTWDHQGRVSDVTDTGSSVGFLYDADGTRVARRDNGATMVQLDGFEWSAANGAVTYYVHPATGERVAYRTTGGVHWLFGDSLGSVGAERTPAGTVVRQRFFPFGGVRSGGLGTELGFTGHRHDPTGLVHMGARGYDPLVGRFVSPDTLVPDPSNPQLLNRYAYVGNNPTNATDPSGHFLHVVVGGAVGAVLGGVFSVGFQAFTTGEVDWGAVGAAAAGGAVSGAVGAATLGVSLVAQGAAAAGASVAAGGVERALSGGEVLDPASIAVDGLIGAATFGAVRGGSTLIRRGTQPAVAPNATSWVDDATAPIGRRGSPIEIAPGTNSPATIGGRQYTGHALDRMQGRGIMASVVDDAIARSRGVTGADGSIIHYRPNNNISVVLNANGSVRTVRYGVFKPR